MSKTHANRQIDAAEVAGALTPTGVTVPSDRVTGPFCVYEAYRSRPSWVQSVTAQR
jgi:hypothetical protein